mgnify:FL=1
MVSKRVVIVGGVAGGASCAARLRRLDEKAEIFVFERGGFVSFANCGMPYFIGGVITPQQRLLVATPERFRDFFNVEIRVNHEVERIDRQNKLVHVLNHQSGARFTRPYDALVLSPGAKPIVPEVPGVNLPGVFSLRLLEDAGDIYRWLEGRKVTRAVVVGGGYIGLEMTENLVRRGISTVLLEAADQLMLPLDPEMTAPIHAALSAHDVVVRLRSPLRGIEETASGLQVLAGDGEKFPCQIVILATGVRPETTLAAEAGLEIGELGGIRVDEQMRTTRDPAIWAVGDAVEVPDVVTGGLTRVPLAGPASRQARVAADAICGRPTRFRGVQGTAVVGLFDLVIAQTGANEKQLKGRNIPYMVSYTHSTDHAAYYPGAEPLTIKLLFAPDSGRLLGAQVVGGRGVDKRIDVISAFIQKGGTVYDLEEAELCYAPQFGSARDPVNIAGFAAGNILRKDVLPAYWSEWSSALSDQSPLVIDVRTPGEHAAGAPPGAINIPLGEIRGRLHELPRDREIWVHCGVGQRSYYAYRILTQHGFRVRNLSGGYKSWLACKAVRRGDR